MTKSEKIEFWKDKDNRQVDPLLFSSRAEDLAKKFSHEHENTRNKPNKRTQMRKFFDEITSLNMAAKSGRQDFQNVLPLVHMLTAKAAYANGRELVSDSFLAFIKESVEQVDDERDLDIFATFFEAFIGFYRLHGPKS
ncbi:MAG: type III-A CRISPR-associated protein Csm2 [Desulfobacteraceae bacterium]|nr:type III-A CRISPR-associated protein Csm2 [Desulfobacteraceae bacterium]